MQSIIDVLIDNIKTISLIILFVMAASVASCIYSSDTKKVEQLFFTIRNKIKSLRWLFFAYVIVFGLLSISYSDVSLLFYFLTVGLAVLVLFSVPNQSYINPVEEGVMSIDWSLVFQGISSSAAIVSAARAALEIKELTHEEFLEIIEKAEEEAEKDKSTADKAAKQIEELDKEDQELLVKKYKEAKAKWREKVDKNNDIAKLQEATDELASEVCAFLRIFKRVNGGKLPPGPWYDIWSNMQCT